MENEIEFDLSSGRKLRFECIGYDRYRLSIGLLNSLYFYSIEDFKSFVSKVKRIEKLLTLL
jgi:hypothetical protein